MAVVIITSVHYYSGLTWGFFRASLALLLHYYYYCSTNIYYYLLLLIYTNIFLENDQNPENPTGVIMTTG